MKKRKQEIIQTLARHSLRSLSLKKKTVNVSINKIFKKLPLPFYILLSCERIIQKKALSIASKKAWTFIFKKAYKLASLKTYALKINDLPNSPVPPFLVGLAGGEEKKVAQKASFFVRSSLFSSCLFPSYYRPSEKGGGEGGEKGKKKLVFLFFLPSAKKRRFWGPYPQNLPTRKSKGAQKALKLPRFRGFFNPTKKIIEKERETKISLIGLVKKKRTNLAKSKTLHKSNFFCLGAGFSKRTTFPKYKSIFFKIIKIKDNYTKLSKNKKGVCFYYPLKKPFRDKPDANRKAGLPKNRFVSKGFFKKVRKTLQYSQKGNFLPYLIHNPPILGQLRSPAFPLFFLNFGLDLKKKNPKNFMGVRGPLPKNLFFKVRPKFIFFGRALKIFGPLTQRFLRSRPKKRPPSRKNKQEGKRGSFFFGSKRAKKTKNLSFGNIIGKEQSWTFFNRLIQLNKALSFFYQAVSFQLKKTKYTITNLNKVNSKNKKNFFSSVVRSKKANMLKEEKVYFPVFFAPSKKKEILGPLPQKSPNKQGGSKSPKNIVGLFQHLVFKSFQAKFFFAGGAKKNKPKLKQHFSSQSFESRNFGLFYKKKSRVKRLIFLAKRLFKNHLIGQQRRTYLSTLFCFPTSLIIKKIGVRKKIPHKSVTNISLNSLILSDTTLEIATQLIIQKYARKFVKKTDQGRSYGSFSYPKPNSDRKSGLLKNRFGVRKTTKRTNFLPSKNWRFRLSSHPSPGTPSPVGRAWGAPGEGKRGVSQFFWDKVVYFPSCVFFRLGGRKNKGKAVASLPFPWGRGRGVCETLSLPSKKYELGGPKKKEQPQALPESFLNSRVLRWGICCKMLALFFFATSHLLFFLPLGSARKTSLGRKLQGPGHLIKQKLPALAKRNKFYNLALYKKKNYIRGPVLIKLVKSLVRFNLVTRIVFARRFFQCKNLLSFLSRVNSPVSSKKKAASLNADRHYSSTKVIVSKDQLNYLRNLILKKKFSLIQLRKVKQRKNNSFVKVKNLWGPFPKDFFPSHLRGLPPSLLTPKKNQKGGGFANCPSGLGESYTEKPKAFSMVNNVYSLSHRYRWERPVDWIQFLDYISAPISFCDKAIPKYSLHRLKDSFLPLNASFIPLSRDRGSWPKTQIKEMMTLGHPRAQGANRQSNFRDPFIYNSSFVDLLFSLKKQKQEMHISNNIIKGEEPSLAFHASLNEKIQRGDISFDKNIAFSGSSLIQKLLTELNLNNKNELNQMDKQNRILLYELNKQISKSKIALEKQVWLLNLSITQKKQGQVVFAKQYTLAPAPGAPQAPGSGVTGGVPKATNAKRPRRTGNQKGLASHSKGGEKRANQGKVGDTKLAKKRIKELIKQRDLLTRRTKLVRKLFISSKAAQSPSFMILSLLPVLPPDLRPIVKMGNSSVGGSVKIATSDLNQLYQKIIYRNERLKKFLKDQGNPPGPLLIEGTSLVKGDLDSSDSTEGAVKGQRSWNSINLALMGQSSILTALKFTQGLLQEAVDNLIQNNKSGVPAAKDSRGRALKSLSDFLKGKQGRFRQYLLGKRVDYSGRSVIIVGPKLKIHQCGIPKEMALELFLPFLLKRILNYNLTKTVIGAKSLIKNNKPLVWELLTEIMLVCPVLLNRAPTLHRLGIQAFIPTLVDGRAILLHPLVCSAFNADFDGDQMAVHVPITIESRAEAWKLMLSRNNLLSPATGDPISIPSQDMVLGCYYLTTQCTKSNAQKKLGFGFYFQNEDDVLKAYHQQKIDLHANVWIQWNGFIEDAHELKHPIEIRITKNGIWKEIHHKSHRNFDKKGMLINHYLKTTPGKIHFNDLIKKSINLAK